MSIAKFVQKFWIQTKTENPLREESLPLTDVVDFNYWSLVDDETRVFTIEIYTNEDDTRILVVTDDGAGNLTEVTEGTLNNLGINTVNYSDNLITITWDATFLSALTATPILEFKLVSTTEEEHIEFKDFLTEVLEEYKQQELDNFLLFYDPENIPSHQLDTLASEHNWVLDRVFSESEEYLRKQLKFLYNIYKTRRTKDAINFAISIIRKTVILYNFMGLKGTGVDIPIDDDNFWVVNQDTIDNYNNFNTYSKFNVDTLLSNVATDPSGVQAIFDQLYDDSSLYYPIKHFLLDLNITQINEDGSILNPVDMRTLKNYLLKIKSQTQYPHFNSTLYIDAELDEKEQSNESLDYKLTEADSLFSLSEYETVTAGPNGIFSRAFAFDGGWILLPFLFNTGYKLNTGLKLNMNEDNLLDYYYKFKVGTGSHATLTDGLNDLEVPYGEFLNIGIESDTDYLYFTCTLEESEANNVEITEMGLFTLNDDMAYYMKFPIIEKENFYKLQFKIKIPKNFGT